MGKKQTFRKKLGLEFFSQNSEVNAQKSHFWGHFFYPPLVATRTFLRFGSFSPTPGSFPNFGDKPMNNALIQKTKTNYPAPGCLNCNPGTGMQWRVCIRGWNEHCCPHWFSPERKSRFLPSTALILLVTSPLTPD
eukprot:EG_transcript_45135